MAGGAAATRIATAMRSTAGTRSYGTFRRGRRSKAMTVPQLALKLFERKKRYRTDTEVSISSIAGFFAKSNAMDLSQGDAYSGIEGHIVRGSGIKFDFWIKNNATTTVVVRYCIVCIRNGVSEQATFNAGSALLEDDSGNVDVTSTTTINKMQARINRDRYQVIMDKKIKLGATSSSDGTDVAIRKHYIPLNGAAFTYDGSGASPQRNIYALAMWHCLGNSDESLGENIELNMGTNFYYVDP